MRVAFAPGASPASRCLTRAHRICEADRHSFYPLPECQNLRTPDLLQVWVHRDAGCCNPAATAFRTGHSAGRSRVRTGVWPRVRLASPRAPRHPESAPARAGSSGDRASVFGTEGRGFESFPARHAPLPSPGASGVGVALRGSRPSSSCARMRRVRVPQPVRSAAGTDGRCFLPAPTSCLGQLRERPLPHWTTLDGRKEVSEALASSVKPPAVVTGGPVPVVAWLLALGERHHGPY